MTPHDSEDLAMATALMTPHDSEDLAIVTSYLATFSMLLTLMTLTTHHKIPRLLL